MSNRSSTRVALKILAYPLAALALAALWTLRPASGEISRTETEFPHVKWSEVEPNLTDSSWVLVDAREEELFRTQHIPGAVSLPSYAYPELLEFFAEDHGTNQTVVIYCGTADCDLSTELARRLRDEAGLTDVRILDGGFLAWQRAR